jgi:hypothetical protein
MYRRFLFECSNVARKVIRVSAFWKSKMRLKQTLMLIVVVAFWHEQCSYGLVQLNFKQRM